MKLKHSEFKMYSDESADKRRYWHLYDARGKSVLTFFDYIADSVDVKEASRSAVEQRAYALKLWFSFLGSTLSEFDVSDDLIKKFRDTLFKRSVNDGRSTSMTRKRTINENLKIIYSFYVWLNDHPIYGKDRNLIGSRGCLITSSLADPNGRKGAQYQYPKLFRDGRKKDKHKILFAPSETDRENLHDYFDAVHGPYVAERNTLIVDIANNPGLRLDSINSLTVNQFNAEIVKRVLERDGKYLVTPARQKNGYSKEYEFSLELVFRIIDFIEGARADVVMRTGSSSGEIFLSEKSGLPLTNKTISTNFAKAARALELPYNSGVHSYRRKFADDTLSQLYLSQAEIKADTGIDTMAALLQIKLGHESIQSQKAYIRLRQSQYRESHAFRVAANQRRLECENAKLKAELAQWRKFAA